MAVSEYRYLRFERGAWRSPLGFAEVMFQPYFGAWPLRKIPTHIGAWSVVFSGCGLVGRGAVKLQAGIE